MKLKKYFLILCYILTGNLIFSQIPNIDFIESLIEEIAESVDQELDYSLLQEDLIYYSQNPLNLNKASREDLEKFQFLSDFHIDDILEYKRKTGNILTVYELQYLKSFSTKDIKRILPFISVDLITEKSIPDIRKVLKYGRNSVFLRTQFLLQDQKGFLIDSPENKLYQGNKLKYYTRYQFDYKRKIKFGFIAEKDAGEAFFKESQKYGFDYYSGHIQINDLWKFQTVTIGDFQVRFGQGLVAWTGLSFGKSSYVTAIKKKYDGLRKYSSTDENKFMRGAGFTFNVRDFEITAFTSLKKIDGNIQILDTLNKEEILITSIHTTGLHRNESELIDRKSISEFIYGANVKWNTKKFKIGLTFIEYFFGENINKASNTYNQFEFQGNHGLNASIDYQTNLKNIYFFGEEAISLNGAYAFLNSMMLKPAPGIALAILQRYYSKDYQAYYASGFAEQSKTQNENGMYFGTEIHPIRKLKISSYFDIFNFPWLKYRVYAPSSGKEFFTQLDYGFNEYIDLYVRYKQESKFINSSDELASVYKLSPNKKKQLRFHINYTLSKDLLLKNRLELSRYCEENVEDITGLMIYQDINYQFSTIPLKINLRIAFFDTDYNARIYVYENDILYGYSVPALNGQGIRTYITLKYTIVKDFIDIWLRYSNTDYNDRNEIGSTYDLIQGNNKSEVKFQIRIKF